MSDDGYKFKSEEHYLYWCSSMVQRIHSASISAKADMMADVTYEIYTKLHIDGTFDVIEEDDE